MGTKLENDASHRVTTAKMGAQLKVWSTWLDELVARSLAAGGMENDAYRIRVEGLRTLLGTVQARLDEQNGAPGGPWGAFQTDIGADWAALKKGVDDLRASPSKERRAG